MKECPVIVKAAAYFIIVLNLLTIPILVIAAVLGHMVSTTSHNAGIASVGAQYSSIGFLAFAFISIIARIIAAFITLRGKMWAYYFLIITLLLGVIRSSQMNNILTVIVLAMLFMGYKDYKEFAAQKNASSDTPSSSGSLT